MSKQQTMKAEPKFAFSLGELLAIVFIATYLVAFFRVELSTQAPSDPRDGPLRRLTVLTLLTVPEAIADVLRQDLAPGWLSERLYLLAMTGGYLLVAAALGSVLLRWLRPQVASSRVEQWVFALGLGLAGLSLGTFLLGVFGLLYRWLFLAIAVAIGIAFAVVGAASRAAPGVGESPPNDSGPRDAKLVDESVSPQVPPDPKGAPRDLPAAWLWMLAPLVILLLSGAMLPPMDFDVREYHLQAPKEFFQNGQIGFLPHNIYANMPLGAEMHALAAMVVTQDWFAGALVGKTIIACFALLTTAAIYSFGCQFFSRSAGVVAAIVYFSTPWVLLVSSSGLIDCVVGCYTMLAIYALALWQRAVDEGDSAVATHRLVLCGLMVGSAVACKYPAVVFVALPIAGWIAFRSFRIPSSEFRVGPRAPRPRGYRVAAKRCLIFSIAAAVVCSPWFAKNWILTGNPTYPLLYSVFGGKTRTPEKDAQWKRAHVPPNYEPGDFGIRIHNTFLKSEWIGPAMAPLALIGVVSAFLKRRANPKDSRLTLTLHLAGYCALVFLLWWLLTHRIDRFLIPLLPVSSLLAGSVFGAALTRLRCAMGISLLALNALYAAAVCAFILGMFNLIETFESTQRVWNNFQFALVGDSKPDKRLLLVGGAAVFGYRVPVLYNTCFDECILEEFIADKDASATKTALNAAGISHIYVDWNELKRYRSPGNYGYSTFPNRELFERLVREHVVREAPGPGEGNSFDVFEVLK